MVLEWHMASTGHCLVDRHLSSPGSFLCSSQGLAYVRLELYHPANLQPSFISLFVEDRVL